MVIEILERTSIAGRPVLPGEVHEVSDRDGRYLIAVRKAQLKESITITSAAAEPKPASTRKPRTRKGT